MAKVTGSAGSVPKSSEAIGGRSPGRLWRADGDADEGESGGLDDDAELDACAGCAERHADADLLGALRDGVGDDAVDAERGEDEAEGGEDRDEV